MELRCGRGGQLEVGDTPFIVKEKIQPLSTCLACDMRYYHSRGTDYRKAPRYYREGPWYFRDSSED